MSENFEVITKEDYMPELRAPNGESLPFYQTKETLIDPERYHAFIVNAERRFRKSQDYKSYKAYLMSIGIAEYCMSKGNIQASDMVDIELHHNIINLFDIFVMICEHVLITVGYISSFDLIQLVIGEHKANRVPITALCTTEHQLFTDDPEGYIEPEKTFGKWWELLYRYRYGITYDIAQKIIKYISKYQRQLSSTVGIPTNEEVLSFAYYNQYGITPENNKLIPENMIRLEDNSFRYGNMDYSHNNYIGIPQYDFY